jgi:hypothetical protein
MMMKMILRQVNLEHHRKPHTSPTKSNKHKAKRNSNGVVVNTEIEKWRLAGKNTLNLCNSGVFFVVSVRQHLSTCTGLFGLLSWRLVPVEG